MGTSWTNRVPEGMAVIMLLLHFEINGIADIDIRKIKFGVEKTAIVQHVLKFHVIQRIVYFELGYNMTELLFVV